MIFSFSEYGYMRRIYAADKCPGYKYHAKEKIAENFCDHGNDLFYDSAALKINRAITTPLFVSD
jgi:hypothetical protein